MVAQTPTPAPLTPIDCDLRDFAFMPLDVVRLRDSDIAALSSGDEFRCAVLLWCASWHQLPAASLPSDDQILSQLAGFGRVVKEWQKVKAGALRGWLLCSDGRLYHPVVAEKAREAWRAKLAQRWKTECARIKKANQRNNSNTPIPSFEEFLGAHNAALRPNPVPEDKGGLSLGTSGQCPQGHDGSVPEDKGGVSPSCPSGNGIQGTVDRDSGQVNLKPLLSGGVHSSTSEGSENRSSPPPAGPDPITLRSIELAALLHQRGAALQASDPRVRAWAERGISDAQALTALETAETRRAEKGSAQAINAGLLDAILTDLTSERPALAGRPPPASRSPTLSEQRRAAATTRLSDVMNDDGTPKTPQQKGFDDGRTLNALTPRLVG